MRQLHRLFAEHEAAHAITARHFGLTVTTIHIGSRDGYTRYHGHSEAWQEATVTAAGDLWNWEFGSVPYQDYGCGDLADFEREHGLDRLWDANRAARSILTQRRRAVLALADRLVAERTIRLA